MSSPVPIQSVEYFGSPPEPLFNDPNNCLGPELLEDTMKLLFQKNEYAKDPSHSGKGIDQAAGHFKDGNAVLFLFELCRHLG